SLCALATRPSALLRMILFTLPRVQSWPRLCATRLSVTPIRSLIGLGVDQASRPPPNPSRPGYSSANTSQSKTAGPTACTRLTGRGYRDDTTPACVESIRTYRFGALQAYPYADVNTVTRQAARAAPRS